jgi:DMSO/TMAO reductase YedYZ heme-binding membrane subunit
MLWLVSRASGIVALVLLTATVVLGTVATAPTRSRTWPRWARQALHRDLALLSVATLAVHVGSVVVDGYVDVRWYAAFVPFTAGYRTPWVALGTVALDLFLLMVVTSLVRVRLGFRTWRAVHWLVYAAWPVAVAHYLLTGTDARTPWGLLLAAAAVLAVTAAVTVRTRRATGPTRTLPPARRAAERSPR